MLQIIKQSHEEKVKMYIKLPKKKIVEMLIECNRIIDAMPKIIYTTKCESGRYLAYYEHRDDILANGDTEIEAKDNLVTLYASVVDYEVAEKSDTKN